MTILERLGKVDNMPLDKLYYLAENCTDHYYTSVIKTIIEIIKQSTTDRQIVLVNMVRALKYLEDFGQRQSQLFTILEKYHLLLDSLENLQSQFGFLKLATSKNVKHLQQAITVQQTYTVNLCTYINNILPSITKLKEAILQLEQKFTTEQDTIQINALGFDLDIDRPNSPRAHNNTAVVSVQEQLASPEPDISDAADFQEENMHRDLPDPTYNNLEESHGYDNFPSTFKIIQQNSSEDHFRRQHQSRRNP